MTTKMADDKPEDVMQVDEEQTEQATLTAAASQNDTATAGTADVVATGHQETGDTAGLIDRDGLVESASAGPDSAEPVSAEPVPVPPITEHSKIGHESPTQVEGTEAPSGDAADNVPGDGDSTLMTESAEPAPASEGDAITQEDAMGGGPEGTELSAAVEGEQVLQGEVAAEPTPETKDDTAPEGIAPGEDADDNPLEEGGQVVPAETGEDGVETTEAREEEAPQVEEEEGGAVGESMLVVGEELSREGSPTHRQGEERLESPPVPGTPDGGSLKEGDEEGLEEELEEEEEPQPEFDRELLIERYHQALADREQLVQQNLQLQHKLGEHFRKKKSEDTVRQEVDKNVTDSEQRYIKYMAQLEDLRRQDSDERDTYKLQIEELKEKCQEKQMHVEEEQGKFMEFQRQVALNALNSRSGKPIPPKDIEQYLAVENRKEAEVVNVRLENIKLKNKLRKKEQQLKSKEELAEGLHLIDFEQLKIENQTYNEKIEERNEDLLKLRKKITSTVQVLTHLKEKLQFVHAENQVLKGHLHEVEDEAGRKRDKLTRTKQARDHLRIDNHRLRQNCGLLGNEPLLRDFEERKDESGDLRDKLETLKMQHAELTLSCNGVRKKLEQARLGRV